MKREEHEQRSIEMFGKPFSEVHAFLDQYFAMFGPYHRIVLHHRRGLELMNQQIPGPVRQVGEGHIIDDLGFIPEDWTDPEFDMDRDYADSWLNRDTDKGLDDVLKELFG
ncbi:MAG: hypothetical protein HUN04_06000 [Desulfobacter sp.]|nr:MAG: hypothetical protein HUN04_06000 [Desulfobacter sp.]